MGRRDHIFFCPSGGFSLMELLFVVTVLAICLAVGSISLVRGLRSLEARGAAQALQAGAAWAQTGVLWHGGAVHLSLESSTLAVSHEYGLCGGGLGKSVPVDSLSTNLARWRRAGGVSLGFGGVLASPDGGGSVYVGGVGSNYRVVVRPESGLTVRTSAGASP